MKYLYAFLIVLLFLSNNSCVKQETKAPECGGKSRWDVKTLSDKEEARINYTPVYTKIENLVLTNPSNKVGNDTRRFDIEFNTYSLECRILKYILEDDGDYHVVLSGIKDPSKTLIAEIPDPTCNTVQISKHNNIFIEVRKSFENSWLHTTRQDTQIFIITGVAFYDIIHNQFGVAPNGIEIHPVLSFKKK